MEINIDVSQRNLRSPETKPDVRSPLDRSFDPNCQSPTLAVRVFAGVLLYACSMCTWKDIRFGVSHEGLLLQPPNRF